jgi:predicted aspartyl protease
MFKFEYVKVTDKSSIPVIDFYFSSPDSSALVFCSNCSVLDTGSDMTVIPFSIANKLLLRSIKKLESFNINGFGKKNVGVPYRILASFDNQTYFSTKVYAIPDDTLNGEVIIGRNILNRYIATFNGPKLIVTISN